MIFWMITVCYEVSYLYIGLLTQPFYITYVGFLNTELQPVRGDASLLRLCRFFQHYVDRLTIYLLKVVVN